MPKVNVTLGKEAHDLLKAYAKSQGWTLANLVGHAALSYLSHYRGRILKAVAESPFRLSGGASEGKE